MSRSTPAADAQARQGVATDSRPDAGRTSRDVGRPGRARDRANRQPARRGRRAGRRRPRPWSGSRCPPTRRHRAEVVKAAADPDEPIQFDATMADWIPPLDARADRGHGAAVAAGRHGSCHRGVVGPGGRAARPRLAPDTARGRCRASRRGHGVALAVFLVAHAALMPLELLAVGAGLALDSHGASWWRCSVRRSAPWSAISLAARIAPANLARWMTPALVPIDPPARRPRRGRRSPSSGWCRSPAPARCTCLRRGAGAGCRRISAGHRSSGSRRSSSR